MAGYGYEIDFLPAGSGDKSGDAIVLRYGEPGESKRHSHNMPKREGWTASTPIPFHSQVEGD